MEHKMLINLKIILLAIGLIMCEGKQNQEQTNSGKNLVSEQEMDSSNKIEYKELVIPDFSGKWIYIHNNAKNDYSLNLTVKKDSIVGTHCFIGMSGNRIDCPEERANTIKGIIKKDGVFEGRFYSEYANGSFKVKMTIASDTLYWVTENISSKVFYSNTFKFIKNQE